MKKTLRTTASVILASSMLFSAGCVTEKQAGEPAAPSIAGEETVEIANPDRTPVKDSTTVIKAPGNSVSKPVSVEVTFKNNRLESVTVVDSGETKPILATVEELFIPRLIEHQSLAVDAVTGATLSSVAVRQAVREAIDQNGGKSSEWFTAVEKSSDVVVLDGYDVIVVGLGGSGMTAYVSAAESGAAVFGFDAAGKIGGTSTNVSGPMAINPQTKMDAENNGQKWFDEEELIADWLEYTQGDAKEDIVRLFVEESGETMDWLINSYDFQFNRMSAFFHPKMWVVWASYLGDKDAMYKSALETARNANPKNDYMVELTGTELITDGGKVTGIRAVYHDGTVYEIYGDSVILATGGFIGNTTMKETYFGSNYKTEAMTQDNGGGINMAVNIGAGIYNIDMPAMVHIAQTRNIIRSEEVDANHKAVLTAMVLKSDALIVGTDGSRFMNEAGNIAFDNWKGGGLYYSVYSADQIESYKTNGMAVTASAMFLNQGGRVNTDEPVTDMDTILEIGEKYGIVARAETIQELADMLKLPGLSNAVAEYNAYANGEKDDPFGKDTSLIHSLENGPFVVVMGAGYYYGTCGGLDIDANMNVLTADGTPIENLYAVGQDSMGVLFTNKDAYVTYGGAAQGWCLTSGRLAGSNAAAKFAE